MAGGRPTKYDSKYVKIVKKMCELGATDFDVIDALGVARSTFYKWKNEYKEFSDALKVGKEFTDDRVEMSLYRRAVGYEHDAVKVMQFQGEPVVIPYREIQHPDVTAAIFWLKNRRPDKWRQTPVFDDQIQMPIYIMPVPTAESVESWESIAKKQQDEILNAN